MRPTNSREKIAYLLLEFGKKKMKEINKEGYFAKHNLKADRFIWENPLAFLVAVILDQSMKAEKVWEIPYLLKERLGHLDVNVIANMKEEEIIKVFNKPPKLHRYPNKAAKWIKNACKVIVSKYGGKVENLWNDMPSSYELFHRLLEFEGISQKKATMMMNILVRDFGIKLKDKKWIDVSYDIHVRRVFLRSGLVKRDDLLEIVCTARELNPAYPGELDFPAWYVGKYYCRPKKPKCDECPLKDVCLFNHNSDSVKTTS